MEAGADKVQGQLTGSLAAAGTPAVSVLSWGSPKACTLLCWPVTGFGSRGFRYRAGGASLREHDGAGQWMTPAARALLASVLSHVCSLSPPGLAQYSGDWWWMSVRSTACKCKAGVASLKQVVGVSYRDLCLTCTWTAIESWADCQCSSQALARAGGGCGVKGTKRRFSGSSASECKYLSGES